MTEIDRAYERGLAKSLANLDAFAADKGLAPAERAECEQVLRASLDQWRVAQMQNSEGGRDV